MLLKVFFILFVLTIYNVLQTQCGYEQIERLNYHDFSDLMSKYSKKSGIDILDDPNNESPYLDQDEAEFKPIENRVSKSYNFFVNTEEDPKPMNANLELNYFNPNNNNDDKLFDNHGIRDEEFLEKSSLWRHQAVQGGMGEGEQKLKPDGSISNIQEVKTDSIIPSYCTPPNPCPLGYTSEDGCLEKFVNTASFSRNFQALQSCMCDSEHMFNCDLNGSSKMSDDKAYNKEEEEERELNTIARSLANQPIGEDTANQFIDALVDHKVVAKKFFIKKASSPFLIGERLPIVAKKSPHLSNY